MTTMNPGESEAVPASSGGGEAEDVNGSNLEATGVAARLLENGSSHRGEEDETEKDPPPEPTPVQIRLISKEGEEKSIQKQVWNCGKSHKYGVNFLGGKICEILLHQSKF